MVISPKTAIVNKKKRENTKITERPSTSRLSSKEPRVVFTAASEAAVCFKLIPMALFYEPACTSQKKKAMCEKIKREKGITTESQNSD